MLENMCELICFKMSSNEDRQLQIKELQSSPFCYPFEHSVSISFMQKTFQHCRTVVSFPVTKFLCLVSIVGRPMVNIAYSQ